MTDQPGPFPEIEELFEQFSQLSGPLTEQLPIDVIDADDEILVKTDLPGRDPASIAVQLEDSRTLQIEVADGTTADEGRFIVRERARQARRRSVTLPAAVDESETAAEYDRGVLTVRLPKLAGDSDGTDIPVN
jgi:HSP20 family protein